MGEIVVVGIAAVLTSILSAVAGLGGGTILLLVIAQYVSPIVAIPIQGAVQLVSNASRSVLLRRQISWPTVGWVSILVFPATLLGVKVATSLPEDTIRVILAVFVLVLAWRPQLLKFGGATSTTPSEARKMLLGVGAMSGFLSGTVGASGPMTSPFYKAVTVSHAAFVATAATTQMLGHIAKLFAFTAQGWAFQDYTGMIGAGIAGVLVGSWIGTRLLGRVPDIALDRLFKVVLTALALRLLFRAIF